jgi:hypothetical protein
MVIRLVGFDGRVVSRPPTMIATAMLKIMFRVRNASIIVNKGGMMLYHGAASIPAVRRDPDRAAIAQMAAKITADAAVLVRIFVFTSSVKLGVRGFLIYTDPTIH